MAPNTVLCGGTPHLLRFPALDMDVHCIECDFGLLDFNQRYTGKPRVCSSQLDFRIIKMETKGFTRSLKQLRRCITLPKPAIDVSASSLHSHWIFYCRK